MFSLSFFWESLQGIWLWFLSSTSPEASILRSLVISVSALLVSRFSAYVTDTDWGPYADMVALLSAFALAVARKGVQWLTDKNAGGVT